MNRSVYTFAVTSVLKYSPPHISERIVAQGGIFTIHPEFQNPFFSDKVHKITICRSYRKGLKKALHKYGICRKTLFPGLEGIAADIEWLNTEGFM